MEDCEEKKKIKKRLDKPWNIMYNMCVALCFYSSSVNTEDVWGLAGEDPPA